MPTDPQDHKKPQSKKPKPVTATIQGVELAIDPLVFDDLDVLDAMDQLNEGNPLRIAGTLRLLTGDRFDDVRTALRDPETGRIPLEKAAEFFQDMMTAAAGPNSSGS